MTSKKLPEHTYNCQLNTVNILVCTYIVTIEAIYWVFNVNGDLKAANLTLDVENLSLVISCFVLVWGLSRLVRLVRDLSKQFVNKGMMILHITAYLIIFIVNAITWF